MPVQTKPGQAFAWPGPYTLQPTAYRLPLLTGRLAFARRGDRRVRGVYADAALRSGERRMAGRRHPRARVRHNRRRGHTGRGLETERRDVGRVPRGVREQ